MWVLFWSIYYLLIINYSASQLTTSLGLLPLSLFRPVCFHTLRSLMLIHLCCLQVESAPCASHSTPGLEVTRGRLTCTCTCEHRPHHRHLKWKNLCSLFSSLHSISISTCCDWPEHVCGYRAAAHTVSIQSDSPLHAPCEPSFSIYTTSWLSTPPSDPRYGLTHLLHSKPFPFGSDSIT